MAAPTAGQLTVLNTDQLDKMYEVTAADMAREEKICMMLQEELKNKRKRIEELKTELSHRSLDEKRATTLQRFGGTTRNKLRLLAALMRAYLIEKFGDSRGIRTVYRPTSVSLELLGTTGQDPHRIIVDHDGCATRPGSMRLSVNILHTHPRVWFL